MGGVEMTELIEIWGACPTIIQEISKRLTTAITKDKPIRSKNPTPTYAAAPAALVGPTLFSAMWIKSMTTDDSLIHLAFSTFMVRKAA